MDPDICLSDICGSCDFPVALHLIELFTAWQSVYERISDQKVLFCTNLKSFTLFNEVQMCSTELELSFIYISHWEGGFGS